MERRVVKKLKAIKNALTSWDILHWNQFRNRYGKFSKRSE